MVTIYGLDTNLGTVAEYTCPSEGGFIMSGEHRTCWAHFPQWPEFFFEIDGYPTYEDLPHARDEKSMEAWGHEMMTMPWSRGASGVMIFRLDERPRPYANQPGVFTPFLSFSRKLAEEALVMRLKHREVS